MQFHFADFTYDADRYELRRGGCVLDVQPKVLAFLSVLLAAGGRALSKDQLLDALWPGVVVEEGSLQRVVSLARRVLGGQASEVIGTVRGVGYRLDVPVRIEESSEARPASTGQLEQEIRFAKTRDGVRIAWSMVGEGPPLVRSLGWFTNLESEWRWPAGRSFWERTARRRTLIRYDGRGIGLSDPCERFSAETRLLDLEAVVEAAGLDRFALLGMSEGCSTAVRFASRHPQRLTHLVLYGIPRVGVGLAPEEDRKHWRTLLEMVRSGWSDPSPVYRQFFSTLFLGHDADRTSLDYFNQMQRASASATTAAHYLGALSDADISEEAQRVTTPTLVMHRRGDVVCPFEAGRRLASLVPGSRFVPLEGSNHWLLLEDAHSDAYLAALDEFLTDGSPFPSV